MEKMHIHSVEDLSEVATKVVELLQKKEIEKAHTIALHGDLGVGKTTFVQFLAKKLGVQDQITSPTFVIMKVYELLDGVLGGKKAKPFSHLIHIDAYRIEYIDEMRVLGFEELLHKKDTIICVEWAEKIETLLPSDTLHLNFTIVGHDREITIS